MTPIVEDRAPTHAHRQGLTWLTCDMCGRYICATFSKLPVEPPDEVYICYTCTGYHVTPGCKSEQVEKLAADAELFPEALRNHWLSLVPAMKTAEAYIANRSQALADLGKLDGDLLKGKSDD